MGLNELNNSKTGRFITIIQGKLSEKVDEGTFGAKKRDYETSSGVSGVKWEVYYKSITGLINGIDFKDSDFGEQCHIHIEDGIDIYTISIQTDSDYFTSLAKKIKSINFDLEVTITPYDFENEVGKRLRGLTIEQNGIKLHNYYYDAESKNTINGFIQPDGDISKYDKDDWKLYFIKVKKFLKSEISSIQFSQEKLTSRQKNNHIGDDIVDSGNDLPF